MTIQSMRSHKKMIFVGLVALILLLVLLGMVYESPMSR